MINREILRDKIGYRLSRTDDWMVDFTLPDRAIDAVMSLTDKAQQGFCLVLGHHSAIDQCMKPEHDFCIWCERRTPGKADRAGADL
jgi:hypothetical protein